MTDSAIQHYEVKLGGAIFTPSRHHNTELMFIQRELVESILINTNHDKPEKKKTYYTKNTSLVYE